MIFGLPTVWIASELRPFLLFFTIWLVITGILWFSRKTSPIFLTLFTLFYFYIYAVLDLALFQFQALLVLKLFIPNLILSGQAAGKEINLIPLISLSHADLKTSLLNILMMIPFGAGLPFLSKIRFTKILVLGFLTSIGIEVIQLVSGGLAGTSFRIADVNDVIFNVLGVVLGYSIFFVAMRFLDTLLKNDRIGRLAIVVYIATLRKNIELNNWGGR